MAQTIFDVIIHVVFSTKNRVKIIDPEIETELFAYIGGIVDAYGSKLICAGGMPDHEHLLISLNKNTLAPDLIGKIKRDSSKWIKTKGVKYSKFAWQDGYAAFSVGHTQIEAVKQYIRGQKEHHRKTLFEDEMRGFLRKYKIPYDENYIWD
jgi:REP element-mobilizing transposase RayT